MIVERGEQKCRLTAVPASGAQSSPAAANSPEQSDTDPKHPFSNLVPEGEYVFSYVSEELGSSFGRAIWFVILEIAEGQHHGKHLLRFYTAPRQKSFLSRSSNLAQDFIAMTGLRPPSKGFRPSELLHGVRVGAYVVTVNDRPPNKRDVDRFRRENQKLPTRIKTPPAARYSRIDSIDRIIAGSPRILGTRHVRC